MKTDDVAKAGTYDLVDSRFDMLAHAVEAIGAKLGLCSGGFAPEGDGVYCLAILFEEPQAAQVGRLVAHLERCLPAVQDATALAGDAQMKIMPEGRALYFWPAVALKLKGH